MQPYAILLKSGDVTDEHTETLPAVCRRPVHL